MLYLLIPALFAPVASDAGRQVYAWASYKSTDIVVQQLRNESWIDIIDGVQVWCNCKFTETGIILDSSTLSNCTAIMDAIHKNNGTFQLMIAGEVPEAAIQDPEPFIKDAIQIAQQVFPHIDGFSIDDERDCAPRSTLAELEEWVKFHNIFAESIMSEIGLQVTSAVQGMFGISDEADNNPCLYRPYDDQNRKPPSSYSFVPRVPELMNHASVQKWLIMDTYYYNTGHFLTTLDWHTYYISQHKLGIGMSNMIEYRDHFTVDELQARFYALDRSGIDWINIFILPINDNFLPFLKRWKNFCRGCGKQSILGCYDFDVKCDDDSNNYVTVEEL